MIKKIIPLALIFGMSFASAARAETIYKLLFPATGFSQETIGDEFIYDQILTNAQNQPTTVKSQLSISQLDNNELNISLMTDGKSRKLGVFPSSIGNPVNMYFLERIVDNMSASAGGSPFYIRNRLKESLLSDAGELHECVILAKSEEPCYSFTPFINDKSKAKMGEFGDMEIEIKMDALNPARIIGLAAVTPKPETFSFKISLIKK